MVRTYFRQYTHRAGSRSAATDLAWRPRARDKATRSGRLPRLLRLGFWSSCGSRRGHLGRLSRRFCCGAGPCCRRLSVVLLETAVFVFAARAAMTGLVAPRSCTRRNSHKRKCTAPCITSSRLSGNSMLVREQRVACGEWQHEGAASNRRISGRGSPADAPRCRSRRTPGHRDRGRPDRGPAPVSTILIQS